MNILMVCMGNICRSPTADAVLREHLRRAGITDVVVDSAGTYGGHAGSPPDRRSQIVAEQRGYSLRDIRSRKLVASDLDDFDVILVMDERNYHDAKRILTAGFAEREALFEQKVRLYLSFHPNPAHREVPDPYTGEADGFRLVLDMIEETSEAFVADIQNVRREFNGT